MRGEFDSNFMNRRRGSERLGQSRTAVAFILSARGASRDRGSQAGLASAAAVAQLRAGGGDLGRVCAGDVGDGAVDAAAAAGLTCVVTVNGYTQDEAFPDATLVVDSLGDGATGLGLLHPIAHRPSANVSERITNLPDGRANMRRLLEAACAGAGASHRPDRPRDSCAPVCRSGTSTSASCGHRGWSSSRRLPGRFACVA